MAADLLHQALPAKPKVHECSICGLEFALGQALGGHMRRHRPAMAAKKLLLPDESDARAVPIFVRSNSSRRNFGFDGLDLNLTPSENALKHFNRSLEHLPKMQPEASELTIIYPLLKNLIELGSTAMNIQSMDLVNKAVQLQNSIHRSKMFPPVQPGDESESSNSVGNSAIVRSNAHLSDEYEEFRPGFHLGYTAWPVKAQYEAKSSSSRVGNYPVPVVKEKDKPQFSGKLYVGNGDHSDGTDINAFLHILKRRRG